MSPSRCGADAGSEQTPGCVLTSWFLEPSGSQLSSFFTRSPKITSLCPWNHIQACSVVRSLTGERFLHLTSQSYAMPHPEGHT